MPATQEIASQQSQIYAQHGLGLITAEQAAWDEDATAVRDFSPDYQKAYPFTTENITSYIGALSLGNARVAAICGSGDFGFSAVMAGAKSVDHVDALKTACLYAELKAVGLQKFDLDAFKQFFGSHRHDSGVTTPGRLKHEGYATLREDLSDQARHYFDQLITPDGPSPYLEHGFLINKITDVPANMDMVAYLQDEASYEAARLSRGESRFYPIKMQDFVASAGDNSYDAVYLSNIGVYMPGEDYEDLLIDTLRVTRPQGTVIETGFVYPGVDKEDIAEEMRANAARLGLTTLPSLVTGPYVPMPRYGSYAAIYTNN